MDMFVIIRSKNISSISHEEYLRPEYAELEVSEYQLEREYRVSLAARLSLPHKVKPLCIKYSTVQDVCDEDTNMQTAVQPWCGEKDISTGLVGVECDGVYTVGAHCP